MNRAPGPSVRLKLTLSYAAFLMIAGALLLAAVWVFLLRYVPEQALIVPGSTGTTTDGVFPVRSNLLRVFAPRAAAVLVFLLVLGLLGDGSSPAGCSRRSPRSLMRHGGPGRGRCPTGSA